MTQGHNAPGASARLDWTALSDDLEAVFVTARRMSSLARLQAAEHARMRTCGDPRQVREAWADANHLLALAADDLGLAVSRLAAQASSIVSLALDADDAAS